MAIEVKEYHFFPTSLIPNSPRPLLHYRNVLAKKHETSQCDPAQVWDIFTENEWNVHWIFRYSDTQLSHYHSQAHECMAVLSGSANIRFGVADTSPDMDENTYGLAWEQGGLVLEANAGDVFIIPAGVAHKTFNTKPKANFALLSPGTGHGIEASDPMTALSVVTLDGFTMMGAYNGGDWDFIATGGQYEKVWAVPKPKYDPVFGSSEQGLCKRWQGDNQKPKARL